MPHCSVSAAGSKNIRQNATSSLKLSAIPQIITILTFQTLQAPAANMPDISSLLSPMTRTKATLILILCVALNGLVDHIFKRPLFERLLHIYTYAACWYCATSGQYPGVSKFEVVAVLAISVASQYVCWRLEGSYEVHVHCALGGVALWLGATKRWG